MKTVLSSIFNWTLALGLIGLVVTMIGFFANKGQLDDPRLLALAIAGTLRGVCAGLGWGLFFGAIKLYRVHRRTLPPPLPPGLGS